MALFVRNPSISAWCSACSQLIVSNRKPDGGIVFDNPIVHAKKPVKQRDLCAKYDYAQPEIPMLSRAQRRQAKRDALATAANPQAADSYTSAVQAPDARASADNNFNESGAEDNDPEIEDARNNHGQNDVAFQNGINESGAKDNDPEIEDAQNNHGQNDVAFQNGKRTQADVDLVRSINEDSISALRIALLSSRFFVSA